MLGLYAPGDGHVNDRSRGSGRRLARMHLVPSLILSGSGVVVAAMAFYNRRDARWQRAMPLIMAIAIGQVLLGVAGELFR
jgi:hypothetical protein